MRKATLKEILALHAEKKLVGAFELTNHDYHAAPGLSKSALDNIAVSPSYYRWRLENPEGWTTALIFGSAYHSKLLEERTFDELFYVTKTQPRDPEKDSLGRMPISEGNLEDIDGMIAHYKKDEIAMKLISGMREISFFWTDESGILCKCKPDTVIPKAGIVSDNKTTTDASDDAFSRRINERRYHVQGSLILNGIRMAQDQAQDDFGIVTPDKFVLVAQEKKAPYEIAAFDLGPNSLLEGDVVCRRDLSVYARCVNENEWPGKGQGKIRNIDLPSFVFKKGINYGD